MHLIVQVLFQSPKPVTTAEDNEHWAYDAAHLKSIPIIFGSRIGEAVERSQVRIAEKTNSPTLQTTESVRAKLPRKNFQDGIIWLDIGFASDFARTLFPQSTFDTNDNDHFTFKGAHSATILSIFDPRIRDAIEASQLRLWEKKHGLYDTTDCVTMRVCRKEPQRGTMLLRIGFILGIDITNSLYAETSIVH